MRHDNAMGLAMVLAMLVGGCTDSAGGEQYRGGPASAEEEGPGNAEGGFERDPACDYVCDATNDEEAVCAQYCPDGCVTIEITRRTETDGLSENVASLSGYCPADFPEPELGQLTCELTYAIPSGHEADCAAAFSEETCTAALNVCLDGL